MRRREFMGRLLGGAAAALVGAQLPTDLDATEMTMVEERVQYHWRNGALVVTDQARNEIVVTSTPVPGRFYRIPNPMYIAVPPWWRP